MANLCPLKFFFIELEIVSWLSNSVHSQHFGFYVWHLGIQRDGENAPTSSGEQMEAILVKIQSLVLFHRFAQSAELCARHRLLQ